MLKADVFVVAAGQWSMSSRVVRPGRLHATPQGSEPGLSLPNDLIENLSLRFADVLCRRSWVVVVLLVAVTGTSAWLMRALRFDFTPQAIYRGDDELVNYSEQFKQTFGYDEALILVVLQATGTDDVLSTAALNWQADAAQAFQTVPGIIRVDSLATLEIPRRAMLSAQLEPVIDERPVTDESAERARELLFDTELIYNGLLSGDHQITAVVLYLGPDRRDLEAMKAAVSATREQLARIPAPTGYRTYVSGLPALRVELVEGWVRDLLIQVPVAGCIHLVMLGLVFRRVSGSVLPIIAVMVGLVWTLAAFAVIGEPLNFVSNALPALLVIIGVSGCTQVVTCYASESLQTADSRLAARNAIARMAPACLLAATTTIVGFMSLMTARSLLLNQFGWQSGIGIGLQYLSTIVLLGALFQYFRPPAPVVVDSTQPGIVTQITALIGGAAARRPWLPLVGAMGLATVSLWFGSRVSINTYSILEVLPEQHSSVRTMRLVEQNLTGIIPLEVSLQAAQPGAFSEPETFHKVVAVEDFAAQLPGVMTVQSYADLYRDVLRRWPGRRPTETDDQLVPPDEAGRNRLERTAKFADRYREALQFDSYMTPDESRARIQLRLSEIGSRATMEVIRALEGQLHETFPPGGLIEARITGEANVNARALTVLINDLYYSLLTASVVIFGMIAVEFRSLKIGLIAALPNLTPLTVTLGYMGLRGYDMNVTNVIVFTICLGLADDNTIYFLYRFRQELARGVTTSEAIQRAFLGTGRAIVLTSGLLLAGLSVLLLSDFVPTRRFAELSTVTLLANLFGVLLLLPACLTLLWKSPESPPNGASK